MIDFCTDEEANKRLNCQYEFLVAEIIAGQDMNTRYSSAKDVMRRAVRDAVYYLITHYNIEA